VKVIFLGTNGWYCTKTGDTPCILIDSEKYYIVLDAGNGIYKLEKHITEDKPIYLFLSHFHLDHIFGLHILSKFKFKQGINIVVENGGRKILQTVIDNPFTKTMKDFDIKISILELPNEKDKLPFSVESFKMFHVDPVLGYRFNLDGKTIAYSGDAGISENSLPLAKNADLLIHECNLLPGMKTAWRHTDPVEVSKLAKDAGAKKLAMVHFDASLYTSFELRDNAQEIAREIFPNTFAMRDEQVIEL